MPSCGAPRLQRPATASHRPYAEQALHGGVGLLHSTARSTLAAAFFALSMALPARTWLLTRAACELAWTAKPLIYAATDRLIACARGVKALARRLLISALHGAATAAATVAAGSATVRGAALASGRAARKRTTLACSSACSHLRRHWREWLVAAVLAFYALVFAGGFLLGRYTAAGEAPACPGVPRI